jgi:YegS/Rv2252/BmrU family lipid kinase
LLDRPRTVALSWAGACLTLFALLAALVLGGWAPLRRLDGVGRPAPGWVGDGSVGGTALHLVEVGFGTIAVIGFTAALAAAMLWRGHRRAAVFVVGVTMATFLLTQTLKLLIDRARPPWQVARDSLVDGAIPSEHASQSAALAGVALVLTAMLVRRGIVRRVLGGASILTVVVVCLDRVLLGRHYPSDVLAGALLGAAVVLVGLALLNPLPRQVVVAPDRRAGSGAGERRLGVVLNPVKVEDVTHFRRIVGVMAAEAGWAEPLWYLTTVEDPGGGMAHEAAVAGVDLVMVCGGDGTLREVCAELAGTGIPIGIVPAGTGNLLARNLEIPLFLRAAIAVALNGRDRAIDLVTVSGDGLEDSYFMVMAGMGLDAAMMEGVNEEAKRKVGWIAYVFSAGRSLMFPAMRVEIAIDGAASTRHRARTVVVGNVGYLQAGMPLLPNAAIDDGLLDVVILHPRRLTSWVPLAARVLTRASRTDDTINRMTGRSVVLRAQSEVPRQLDGDSVGAGQELRMECLHGRVVVRVPR